MGSAGQCAALCFPLLAQPVGDDASQQSRTDKAQDQPKTDNTPLKLEAVQDELNRIARAIEAQKDDAEAERKENREIRDLDAQERMAGWAERLFWITAVTVFLTFVGIIGMSDVAPSAKWLPEFRA